MDLDADFEAAAALLAAVPEGAGGNEGQLAELGGEFEAAVALLERPAPPRQPAAGFAQRSPALLQHARAVRENKGLKVERDELQAKLAELRGRHPSMAPPCTPVIKHCG